MRYTHTVPDLLLLWLSLGPGAFAKPHYPLEFIHTKLVPEIVRGEGLALVRKAE